MPLASSPGGLIANDIGLINRVLQIRDTLERASTFDSWGQVLEADVEYKKMIDLIGNLTKSGEGTPFMDIQVKFLDNVAVAAHMRSKSAQDLTGEFGLRLDQVLKLIPMIEPIMCTDEPHIPEFPIREVLSHSRNLDQIFGNIDKGPSNATGHRKYRNAAPVKAQMAMAVEPDDDVDDNDEDSNAKDIDMSGGDTSSMPKSGNPTEKQEIKFDSKTGGTLLPFKRFQAQTNISITLLKIRLQDPHQYIEPFICVSVKDSLGQAIRGVAPQDIPYSTKIDDEFVYFNQVVHLQLPLEALQSAEAAIFLEFKHYKVKKSKQSVKCWSMLEMDELNAVNGVEMPLEIYQKPTDFKKKKLTLLTNKAYYLYVHITRKTD